MKDSASIAAEFSVIPSRNTPGITSPAQFWITAILIFVAAIYVRASALGVDGLWMDEIFSAAYVNLSVRDLIIAVLRFDVHPPLYYLQLKAWAELFNSDSGLLLNSIAWSMLTLILASLAAFRIAGRNAALFTGAIIAVAGSDVHYAVELRMYAMVSCLTVLAWICVERYLASPVTKQAIYLVGVIGFIAGAHGSAFIPITSILLYLLLRTWESNGFAGVYKLWPIFFSAALLLAPWMLNASFRSVTHAMMPDYTIVVRTISGWLLGYGELEIPSIFRLLTAFSITAFVCRALMLGARREKYIVLCFVLMPLVILGSISFVVRPMWLDRAVSFSLPFLALSLGTSLAFALRRTDEISRFRTYLLLGVFLGLFFVIGISTLLQSAHPRKMQYREAAEYIMENNVDKRPVYAPTNVTFWALARYLRGPDWGSLLEINDSMRMDHSESWRRIYDRLGPEWLARLHLLPLTRQLASPFGTLWIGMTPLPDSVLANPYWLVGNNALLDSPNNCLPAQQISLRTFRGVVVVFCGGAANNMAGR